jgi:hypothetical protein
MAQGYLLIDQNSKPVQNKSKYKISNGNYFQFMQQKAFHQLVLLLL